MNGLGGAQGDADAALLRVPSRVCETIEWIPVSEALPDDNTTVLIDFATADPWLGWYEDGEWRDVSAAPVEHVIAWAHMPEGCGL